MVTSRQKQGPTANPYVLDEHLDSAEYLWLQRDQAVRDPSFSLSDLAQVDTRLSAHLYGIRYSGSLGRERSATLAGQNSPGAVFCAAATALDQGDGKLLDTAVEAGELSFQHQRALLSAAGWVEQDSFTQFANVLLSASSGHYQLMGIAGCALRRLDIGDALGQFLESQHPVLRARACRAVAELGRKDLLPALQAASKDEDLHVRFWSTWAACFQGDHSSIAALRRYVADPMFADRAMAVYFRICSDEEAKALLRGLAANPSLMRHALIGSGVFGDPFFASGLIARMTVPEFSRIAGHAFSLICGVDLEEQGLVLAEEPDVDTLSDEDSESVFYEADDALPWPDAEKVLRWWSSAKSRFIPGKRYLAGHVISSGSCTEILRVGQQHQRAASAVELALHSPGQPVFEWRAPGYRQQSLLG